MPRSEQSATGTLISWFTLLDQMSGTLCRRT